jgi:hypothetical protein
MRSRVRNAFEVLGMSALDLFASSLGVFVLVVFVLLPFYLRQPTIDAAFAGAQAELAAIERDLALYRARLTAAAAARRDAEAALAAAQRRMEAARMPEPEAKAAPPAAAAPAKKPGAIAIPPLDLVIAIDTTGSMRDELVEVQSGIFGIIRILDRLSPSLAVGIVAYRDTGEEYVTRVHPLAPLNGDGLQRTLRFIDSMTTKGGGDDPEALDAALAEAAKLAWRAGTLGRLIVIGDQPPHPPRLQAALDLAAGFRSTEAPGRTVGAIFAGEETSAARGFFEALARAGGGDFRVHRGEMIESILLSVLNGARSS